MSGVLRPPVAPKRPHTHREHGVERDDPYQWLRERDDPAVAAHLEAENAYADAVMAPDAALRERLFEEIKGRIRQDDETYPVRWKRFLYYERYEEGAEYPRHWRRPAEPDGAAEELMLDVPALAAGHEYFDLEAGDVSPDERLLAYSVDLTGDRVETLFIKDLESGEALPDRVDEVDGGHAWSACSRFLFYTKHDPETLRSFQVWRHELGTPADRDALVFEEGDETFEVSVAASKSGELIFITSSQTLSDEVWLLRADAPLSEPHRFAPRRRGLEYEVEHHGDGFYIRTNLGAPEFRLMRTPVGATGEAHWEEVFAMPEGAFLVDFELFDGFLVTSERERGLDRLRVRRLADPGAAPVEIAFDEPAYSAWIGDNLHFESRWLRYGYSSPSTPDTLYEQHLETGERRLLKQLPVPGGYDPADYVTERVEVAARDGARVPVSLVYRRGRPRDGGGALLLEGYGAYGISSHATFSAERLPLLDRGFCWAIAHVRGGQELGRAWYEAGRQRDKRNTFNDFIDCAEQLASEGYGAREKLCATGGSAGGLLLGAVLNERPDLFAAAVAHVPFVDVVTTMLDDSIPLTAGEFDEWGDPSEREAFDTMLGYSPYDNVRAADYPALLVVAGFHDSQVQYWEPAKWVARLRERGTGARPILLKTEMDSGHGGASGRHDGYRETARDYAFLLRALGVKG